MALIKFGGGVVGMAGKIAGTVFARNRYGQYARGWAKPVNVNTERQDAVRGLTGILAAAWRALDTAVRDGWKDYADAVPMVNRLGETMNLSGYNHYCRSNAARMHAGLDIVDDAPTVLALAEQDPDLEVALDVQSQELDITFDETADWVGEDGAAMMVFMGLPQNPTVNFFNGPWRYAGKIEGNATTAPSAPATVSCPFPVAAGQRVFVQARISRAGGRLSAPFRAQVG